MGSDACIWRPICLQITLNPAQLIEDWCIWRCIFVFLGCILNFFCILICGLIRNLVRKEIKLDPRKHTHLQVNPLDWCMFPHINISFYSSLCADVCSNCVYLAADLHVNVCTLVRRFSIVCAEIHHVAAHVCTKWSPLFAHLSAANLLVWCVLEARFGAIRNQTCYLSGCKFRRHITSSLCINLHINHRIDVEYLHDGAHYDVRFLTIIKRKPTPRCTTWK